MNTTKIDWATHVWNIVTGCYGPGGTAEHPKRCSYCYARRMALRLRGRFGYPQDEPFRPTYHSGRLWEPYSIKPSRIFVASMGELFQETGFPVETLPSLLVSSQEVIATVLRVVKACPQHTFIFLTKNPHLLANYNPWPDNAWVGVSATDGDMFWGAGRNLGKVEARVKFISVEPLLGPVPPGYRGGLQWLVIGAQTGPGCQKHWPRREWVDDLGGSAREVGIPVFMKSNLLKPFPTLKLIQEFPYV